MKSYRLDSDSSQIVSWKTIFSGILVVIVLCIAGLALRSFAEIPVVYTKIAPQLYSVFLILNLFVLGFSLVKGGRWNVLLSLFLGFLFYFTRLCISPRLVGIRHCDAYASIDYISLSGAQFLFLSVGNIFLLSYYFFRKR